MTETIKSKKNYRPNSRKSLKMGDTQSDFQSRLGETNSWIHFLETLGVTHEKGA